MSVYRLTHKRGFFYQNPLIYVFIGYLLPYPVLHNEAIDSVRNLPECSCNVDSIPGIDVDVISIYAYGMIHIATRDMVVFNTFFDSSRQACE